MICTPSSCSPLHNSSTLHAQSQHDEQHAEVNGLVSVFVNEPAPVRSQQGQCVQQCQKNYEKDSTLN